MISQSTARSVGQTVWHNIARLGRVTLIAAGAVSITGAVAISTALVRLYVCKCTDKALQTRARSKVVPVGPSRADLRRPERGRVHSCQATLSS